MLRVTVLLLIAVPALASSLHWRAVDVEARLQRDGSLRVRERQQMVFDGDWTYAERRFSGAPQHASLQLHGIARLENGRETPLTSSFRDALDEYQLFRTGIYRWGVRRPGDPPFENRELTYVLDYTWHNVLDPVGTDGQRFRLDHEFGMAWRAGDIERYTLTIDFDPVWNMPPIRETRTEVAPGDGLRIDRTLYYSGEAWPPDVERPVPWWLGIAALLFYAAGAALLVRRFIHDERPTGRFDPLPAQFDPELLKLKPEIAGAIWDGTVGPSEVAATLARMAQEKKIVTRVENDMLVLNLAVPRDTLEGYERYLVDAVFVDGDSTSTAHMKAHYKRTGFNPAAVIRPRLEWELAQLPGWAAKVRRVNPVVHVLLLPLCAFGLLVAALFGHESDLQFAMGLGFNGAFFGGLAALVAWYKSRAIADFVPAFLAPGLLAAVPLLVFASGALQAQTARLGTPVLFVAPVWLLAILHFVLAMLRIRQPREVIAFRRRIAAARKFFMQPEGARREEWLPYMLAFGLYEHVPEALAVATFACGVGRPSRRGGDW